MLSIALDVQEERLGIVKDEGVGSPVFLFARFSFYPLLFRTVSFVLLVFRVFASPGVLNAFVLLVVVARMICF